MANHQDHQEEQEQSRPFLASTEAHEATLMKDAKSDHENPPVPDDDPAPLLPSIVHTPDLDQPASNELPDQDDADLNQANSGLSQEILHQQVASTEPELKSNQSNSYYPNSRRIVASTTIALVALVGFSAVWYNANQDIYTLGGSTENSDETSQAASNPTKPQSTQPATLGAETNASTTTEFTLNNLPALTHGFYHVWHKQGDTTTSLGQFSVNDQGEALDPNNQAFSPKLTANQAGATLLVSIESTKDPTQPSNTIILSGSLTNGKAKLSFTAIDLANASGVYTIAAPTDLSGEHQSSGIWLAKSDGNTLTGPGLTVPTAPEGWKYEAQLTLKDQIIAAGRFSNPNDRDDFGVFTPNPDQTPSFPGEDYLQGAPSRLGIDFPANLTSGEWKVIISIEPDQNGTDPTGDDIFYLQPFTATIAKDTKNYTEQPLTLDVSKFPTATISVK